MEQKRNALQNAITDPKMGTVSHIILLNSKFLLRLWPKTSAVYQPADKPQRTVGDSKGANNVDATSKADRAAGITRQ